MTCLNCTDGFLLFLYKEILLARESRSVEAKLPRKMEVALLLDSAGIIIIPAQNKRDMEQKLKDQPSDINTLFLNTGKKAILEQLFRHLRNAVAHADYRCNQKAGSTVEIFHEYGGTKRLFGTVQQQSLRKLVRLMQEDG